MAGLALSVVISTYNRADLLPGAIGGGLSQVDGTPPFELIVVDNRSTDGTKSVVEGFTASDPRVRYVYEPQQGLSPARNAAVRAWRAAILAFTDDDVRVPGDWVRGIVRAFEEWPGADVVGGKVLPDWPSAPPAWLTPEHWAPLALVDYGDEPLRL